MIVFLHLFLGQNMHFLSVFSTDSAGVFPCGADQIYFPEVLLPVHGIPKPASAGQDFSHHRRIHICMVIQDQKIKGCFNLLQPQSGHIMIVSGIKKMYASRLNGLYCFLQPLSCFSVQTTVGTTKFLTVDFCHTFFPVKILLSVRPGKMKKYISVVHIIIS